MFYEEILTLKVEPWYGKKKLLGGKVIKQYLQLFKYNGGSFSKAYLYRRMKKYIKDYIIILTAGKSTLHIA